MNRKHQRAFTLTLIFAFALAAAPAFAQTVIDFEDGVDGAVVVSPVAEIIFSPTAGSNWIYGDWRATIGNGESKYDGPYPDGAFWSEGNFWANVGPTQDNGRVTLNYGTNESTFSLGYSCAGTLTLNAYDLGGNVVDSDSGPVNTETGELNFLSVEGLIAWVEVVYLGNHWIIDRIEVSEIIPCLEDEECMDEDYCNGEEQCVSGHCAPGIPVDCDDGLFCNGDERCNELSDECTVGVPRDCGDDGVFCNGPEICSDEEGACISAGNPCQTDELCREDSDRCVAPALETPAPGWPSGEITGGCCGC